MSKQLEKLKEHAAGMMLTDHSEAEVREWLERKHRIAGEEADPIVEHAMDKRRAEVRGRALLRTIFSGVGMLLFATFLFLQWAGGFVIVGIPVIVCWVLGVISFPIFVKSLVETISGETNKPLH